MSRTNIRMPCATPRGMPDGEGENAIKVVTAEDGTTRIYLAGRVRGVRRRRRLPAR